MKNIKFVDSVYFLSRELPIIVVYVRYLYSFVLPKCPLTTFRSRL